MYWIIQHLRLQIRTSILVKKNHYLRQLVWIIALPLKVQCFIFNFFFLRSEF